MSGLEDLTPGEIRELLRQCALIVAPGETLIIMVSDHFTPRQVRELNDSLNAIAQDPWWPNPPPPPPGTDTGCTCTCSCPACTFTWAPMRVIVVPGTAVTVAQIPEDPFPDL
jgi:hypothetical protein